VYDNRYRLEINYSLPNGLYGELYQKESAAGPRKNTLMQIVPCCDNDIQKIKGRMQELIASDLPYIKTKKNLEESVSLFEQHGQPEKAFLAKSTGNFFNSVYYLDGYGDTFYGPMLHSTGYITKFDLVKYNNGFCLQAPEPFAPDTLPEVKVQDKLYDIFARSGLINKVKEKIDKNEIESLKQDIEILQDTIIKYQNTFGTVVNGFIDSLPTNMEKAKEIVESISPEKMDALKTLVTSFKEQI
jgi:uridine kinase